MPLNARITTAHRSAHQKSPARVPWLATVLLLAIGLGACGGDGGLVRQDYNAVIAPERCGGVSTVSCAGYQFTPTDDRRPVVGGRHLAVLMRWEASLRASAERPNVLVLMSDQHNPLVSSPYGHPFIQTPAIQSLGRSRRDLRPDLLSLAPLRAVAFGLPDRTAGARHRRLGQLLSAAADRTNLGAPAECGGLRDHALRSHEHRRTQSDAWLC